MIIFSKSVYEGKNNSIYKIYILDGNMSIHSRKYMNVFKTPINKLNTKINSIRKIKQNKSIRTKKKNTEKGNNNNQQYNLRAS